MAVDIVKDEFDQQQFDPFTVQNRRQGYRYRLLNNNERNIASKLRKGYEIVKDSDPEKLALTDSTPMKKGADLDTTQRFNDVVLARIPEDKFERLAKRNRGLVERRSGQISGQFKKETGEFGFDARSGSGGSTIYSGQVTAEEFFSETKGGKGK